MFIKFIDKFLLHEKNVTFDKKNEVIEGLDENGNICLVQQEEVSTGTSNEMKKIIAEELGLIPTKNQQIYYDEEKKYYRVWDEEKQKFKKDKTIVKIYDNAYVERIGKKDILPVIYRPDGEKIGLKSKDIMIEVLELKKVDKSWIPSGWGHFFNLHYSEKENKYYMWNDNERDFILSEITDIAGDCYFAKGDKYYKAGYGHEPDIEITAEEFYSKKEK